MMNAMAGEPRISVLVKGHSELMTVYTYVRLPHTVNPRGLAGK